MDSLIAAQFQPTRLPLFNRPLEQCRRTIDPVGELAVRERQEEGHHRAEMHDQQHAHRRRIAPGQQGQAALLRALARLRQVGPQQALAQHGRVQLAESPLDHIFQDFDRNSNRRFLYMYGILCFFPDRLNRTEALY